MPEDLNVKIIPPKDYLPKIAAVVAAVLVIFLLVLAVSEGVGINNKIKEGRYIGQENQFKNTISVSSDGKIVSKPDVGQVSLSVLSDATTVAAAQKDNTEKMNNIISAMKGLGIKEEDIKTSSYTISPKYQYYSGKSEIYGYQVSQTIEVKIRNLDNVSPVLGKAATLGANQVGSLTFTFDDSEKIKDEARQKAVELAQQKAKDIAASLGVSLGKLTSFSESFSGEPAPVYYSASSEGRGGGGGAPDIQPGSNEVQVTVYLTYEIY